MNSYHLLPSVRKLYYFLQCLVLITHIRGEGNVNSYYLYHGFIISLTPKTDVGVLK